MLKRLLTDSLSIVFYNLETVFKVCGSWFVLQFLLSVIVLASGAQIEPGAEPGGISGNSVLLLIIGFVIALFSSASISVAWHRFGLMGELPKAIHLRVGAVEVRFIGKMLLLSLAMFCIMLPVSLIIGLISGALKSNVLTVTLWVITALMIIPVLFRLNLVLPATAVERPIGIRAAFVLGEGFGLPMFLAAVILILPLVLAGEGLQLVLAQFSGSLPAALIQMKVLILNVLIQIIVTVLGISVLTAGYRMAMERAEAVRLA